MSDGNDEEWTPLVGWRKAIIRILVRAVLFVPIAAGGLLILLAIIHAFDLQMIDDRLVGMIAVLTGLAGGWVMSRGLVNSTGIGAGSLILPVAGALTATGVLMFFGSQVVFAMFHVHLRYEYFGVVAIAAVCMSGFKLYIE